MKIDDKEKLGQLREFMNDCKKKPHPESHLIAILHKAQDLYGYLPREVMDDVAIEMNIPTAHIWGVATFYHYFNLKKLGEHVISVCLGTACYVNGAEKVVETLKRELGIDPGETTADGMFTLASTRCLGACGLAPVMMVDNKIYGELNTVKIKEIIKTYYKESE
ncbi:NADH:ubiquinone oxidoreductase, 24 kDa subunit [Candidatus Omnitrophus magneticus]|uniref:NADH:ubiquinone oxidoreductase, 24 kDa subunit n=1 Tax=Candidatus Omnitrophus magneticus TaxID=1609969 RepID=A0A0F0CNC4_9BACT|nr:NADH:ubiquinone oxidoreductase, 24 kDa subunit [Candidatus Omnitrophus magneticus]